MVIVDVFNRKNLMAKYKGKKSSSKQREYPSFFLLQQRTISTNGDYLCDLWEVRDKAGGQVKFFEHAVRLYGAMQLTGLLEAAGFAVKRVYGDYEAGQFKGNSPRLIIVANAK
jgi:hypothetical protein